MPTLCRHDGPVGHQRRRVVDTAEAPLLLRRHAAPRRPLVRGVEAGRRGRGRPSLGPNTPKTTIAEWVHWRDAMKRISVYVRRCQNAGAASSSRGDTETPQAVQILYARGLTEPSAPLRVSSAPLAWVPALRRQNRPVSCRRRRVVDARVPCRVLECLL
ncbi:unnamed protein product [Prorocentrum cordatum]|uniref:Integrase zinc-binding domain-containing protein n=2 Tax=Prorocentrum cordatum TaxID=2364126 RepID=A0ABN9QS65_9DINO|nr:unnamed protein product [Polarella glacialis]